MKQKKHMKSIVRSQYSGKVLNGKPVILCSEAIDFIKSKGYEVISPNLFWGKDLIK